MNISITGRLSHVGRQGRFLRWLAAALLPLCIAAPSWADDYPSKPIELVTHSGAGGGTDLTTRFAMNGARAVLDSPMEVVNRVGGSGSLSMEYLKNRGPEGYTVLTFTNTHINPLVQGRLDFKIEDMVPLARATEDPQIVFVSQRSPHQSLEDVARASASRPAIFGVSNIGSIDHIAAHLIAKAADIKYTAVPYRGGTAVLTSLVSGDMEIAVANYAEASSLLQNDDIRALAILDNKRSELLPDVPTAIELGYDVQVSTLRGFVALAGTDPKRLEILERSLLEGMRSDEFQAFLKNNGMSPDSVVGSAEWGEQIREMYTASAQALQELGVSR